MGLAGTLTGMDTVDPLTDEASELTADARTFHAAAQQPNCSRAAPASLAFLEETLQVLSAAWYQVAADASPGITERRSERGSKASSSPQVNGLSREQDACLTGTLHDIAAALARCARACREGRLTVTPIVAQRVTAERVNNQRRANELSGPERRARPTRHVA